MPDYDFERHSTFSYLAARLSFVCDALKNTRGKSLIEKHVKNKSNHKALYWVHHHNREPFIRVHYRA